MNNQDVTLGQAALSSMACFILSLPVFERRGETVPYRFISEIGGFLERLENAEGDGVPIFLSFLKEGIIEGSYAKEDGYVDELKSILDDHYGGCDKAIKMIMDCIRKVELQLPCDKTDRLVFLTLDDQDHHGEGCGCGLCNGIGKSYGVGIFEIGSTEEPLDRIYGPSEETAIENARMLCVKNNWQVLLI